MESVLAPNERPVVSPADDLALGGLLRELVEAVMLGDREGLALLPCCHVGNLSDCETNRKVVWFAPEMTVITKSASSPVQLTEKRLRIPVRLTIMEPAEIGRRIRTARAWAGLSQEELAQMLEVSEATVRRMEQGKKIPRSSDLLYIAEICGVRRSWFTDDDPGIAPTAPDPAAEVGDAFEAGERASDPTPRKRGANGAATG